MGGEEGKGVSGEGDRESSGASESGKGRYGHLGARVISYYFLSDSVSPQKQTLWLSHDLITW